MSVKQSLKTLLARDLSRLFKEIENYKDETKLWIIAEDISNSGGNLCLHLIGNLSTYLAKELGGFPYERDRPAEFSTKGLSKETLLTMLKALSEKVEKTMESLTDEQLSANYPDEVLGYPMTSEYFIIHLSGHLNYHLGQINYHRRLLDTQS
ncbi:Protein of unknown function [Pseudarcicella hirudinis]|uniref:DinB-like domain-containing protein n=1 Tax=Pseudarcicella hirudinis TaxID=1079859 RepID=A0A1I5WDQ3_9BACT|nr:DinB family protein [Pseudarcicella hirudinis]SFQ17777.1 Protein of unknown function [Pseudarcicella hirudinis]